MDNPSLVLYWTLRHGQRRQIAEEFGVIRAADRRMGDLQSARLWLGRLRDGGSLAKALERARRLHQTELRRIETNIREYGAHSWRTELESWRDHKYRLLALSESEYAATTGST